MAQRAYLEVELIAHTPEPDKLVAASARICYSSYDVMSIMDNMTPKQVEDLIHKLTNMGHESPFEHASFTFSVSGVSRTLLAQITRHRIASYSVRSQRYLEECNFGYIIPKEITRMGLDNTYIQCIEQAQESYDTLFMALMDEYLQAEFAANPDSEAAVVFKEQCEENVDDALIYICDKYPKIWNKHNKKAAENARYLCPNATETKFSVTMNARSLLNFFNMRCCNRAQEEIHDLADAMLCEVLKVSPLLFRKAGAPCASGACSEGSMSCGQAVQVREKYSKMKEGLK